MYDPFIGNKCGVDVGFEDYEKIYFLNPEIHELKRTVCVSHCPSWSKGETAP